MAIRQRTKNGPWYVDLYYQDNNGTQQRLQRSTGTRNRREAEQIARQMEKQLQTELADQRLTQQRAIQQTVTPTPTVQPVQVTPPQSSVPFSGFAKRWFDQYVVPNNKPSTQRNKNYHIRVHLAPCFGHDDLHSITVERIEVLKATLLNKRLGAKSVNNVLGTLRTLLSTAVDWGYLDRSPMDRVKPLKTINAAPDFFSRDEVAQFLASCRQHKPEWHDFFATAFLTGMRRGELLALQWKDIDFERGIIKVRRSIWNGLVTTPKGGKERVLPINPELRTILEGIHRSRSLFVFHQDNGQPLEGHHVQKALVPLRRKAGLRSSLRFHDMRHTFASHLVINGVSIRVVQELMGHSDIKTTLVYAHLNSDSLKGAVNTLSLTASDAGSDAQNSDTYSDTDQNPADSAPSQNEKSQQIQ
ncbi:MAG: tyrosine-type recombinase/integrase [Deltaproteobacteria bacterium]|nr:tyrosine-type recombinase/integrase [Deltaproteobacteria bacterium]